MKLMLVSNSTLTDEAVEEIFNGKDHWYTADDCVAKEFILTKGDEEITPPNQISNITRASLLQKMNLPQNKYQPMADKTTIDFETEIKELKASIAELKTQITPDPEPDPVPADPAPENSEELTALKTEMKQLTEELAKFKKAPAVDPATPNLKNDGNQDSDKDDELDKFNQSLMSSQGSYQRFR